MELIQNFARNDGWVSWFRFGGIGTMDIFISIRDPVGLLIGGSHTALFPCAGWRNRRLRAVRRDQIMDDVFDEEALALQKGEYTVIATLRPR